MQTRAPLRRRAALVALLALTTFAPAASLAQADRGGSVNTLPVNVAATLEGVTGQFVGTITTEIASVAGQLVAAGTINGTFTDAAGNATQIVNETFATLVEVTQATPGACDILNLDLGPLHLDLLGLVIDLSAIELDVVAQPGPGNLLGNLLCAVAGLLDGGNTNAIANLLNRILAILGG